MGLLNRLFGRSPRSSGPDKNAAAAADQDWEYGLTKDICIAMIRQIPEDWDTAFLVLEPTDKGFGPGLAHSAIMQSLSDDGSLTDGNFVTPGPEVMAATRALELQWPGRRELFQQAIFGVARVGGEWTIKSDYEYAD